MKIQRASSPEKMIDAFKARIDQLDGQDTLVSSTVITSSSQMYKDVGGGFGGTQDEMYSEEDLRSIWDRDHNSDPCMEEYTSYDAWMNDNINNGWLKRVDAGCHAGTDVIDDDLEDVTGQQDSEFIIDDGSDAISASFNVNSIDVDRLYDVIDKYNTSSPVSGDWDKETEDEQKTIADEFGISLDDAKEVMIKILGFPEDDKFISASTKIECHEYIDETGDAFGEPGITYTEDDLRKYFDENKLYDPSLQGYSTFEDWLADTIDNTNLRFAYVDGGCHVDVNASFDDWDDIEDSEWEELSHKTVYDSDGFTTDYTLYFNPTTGQYVTVFGDRDLYRPEDGWNDAEFDNEAEAYEWFESYNTDEYAE